MSAIISKFGEIYNHHYKKLLVLPILFLVIALGYVAYFSSQNGDFIKKDISLTGGIEITVFSEKPINLQELNDFLSQKLDSFSLREISDFRTGKQKAIIISAPMDSSKANELKSILEDYLDYSLTDKNSSIESTGSALSQSFYSQLRLAIIISFILMSIVVFAIFRTLVPGGAVVLSAFADIVMTIALIDFLGIRVSAAGITALLMLIGYSVDTDILLTSRLLKSQKSHKEQVISAFKTGMTMTLTAITAVAVAYFFTHSFSETLKQIFLFLMIGLGFDIFNTWVTNLLILKWYIERKERKNA
jgi:preprotein translocase subunit SecF